jgi:hypothetical protein
MWQLDYVISSSRPSQKTELSSLVGDTGLVLQLCNFDELSLVNSSVNSFEDLRNHPNFFAAQFLRLKK